MTSETRAQIGALLDEHPLMAMLDEYAKAYQFHTECEREYDREECGADVLDQARAELDGIRDEIIAALDALTAEHEASARDAETLREELETSEREAAANWQKYWDLYSRLTTVVHYSPAQALTHLARQHEKLLQQPDQQPVYGPRAAFIIAAIKGAELLEELQARADAARAATREEGQR